MCRAPLARQPRKPPNRLAPKPHASSAFPSPAPQPGLPPGSTRPWAWAWLRRPPWAWQCRRGRLAHSARPGSQGERFQAMERAPLGARQRGHGRAVGRARLFTDAGAGLQSRLSAAHPGPGPRSCHLPAAQPHGHAALAEALQASPAARHPPSLLSPAHQALPAPLAPAQGCLLQEACLRQSSPRWSSSWQAARVQGRGPEPGAVASLRPPISCPGSGTGRLNHAPHPAGPCPWVLGPGRACCLWCWLADGAPQVMRVAPRRPCWAPASEGQPGPP